MTAAAPIDGDRATGVAYRIAQRCQHRSQYPADAQGVRDWIADGGAKIARELQRPTDGRVGLDTDETRWLLTDAILALPGVPGFGFPELSAIEAGTVADRIIAQLERDAIRSDGEDAEANGHDAEAPLFPVYTARQMFRLPPVPMRIPALSLPKKGLAGLVGQSGHGKGLVSEDAAVCLAIGRRFREFAVEQCAVGIIAAEGFSGVPGRQRAVYAHHGIAEDADVPLFYIAAAPQLDDAATADRVAAQLRGLKPRPEALFVDTYRATNSGDENDSTDAARYIRSLQMLSDVIDGLVVTIMHAPWNGERERGSTAFRAAMDWVGLVQKQDDIITMSCLKAKDGPEFKPLRWRIEAWADSATVVPIGETEEERETPRRWADIPHSGQRVLEALAKSFDDQGATSANLRKASRVPESTYFRIVKQLGDWGLLMKHRSRLLLTATARGILP